MVSYTPLLYVLIIFVAIVVAFLVSRIMFMRQYLKKLKATLERLGGDPYEREEHDE